MPAKKNSKTALKTVVRLPGYAQILAELGPKTEDAVINLTMSLENSSLFAPPPQLLPVLGDALKEGWHDDQAAEVIRAVVDRLSAQRELDLTALTMWIRAHRGDAQAVSDCLIVEPPEEITILQLLSRAGSQKLVFLANWQIAQREVVLKRFIGDGERLIPRELQPHPLSMAHPNIIETHLLRNKNGEGFLVERRLPVVLNDSWPSHGLQEAANLLRDIASALAFLQDKQLVHGDIKPDNIGFEEGNYILLDFGICRPHELFAEDATPTGSLRTRAPEVLLDEKAHSYPSDVWALGATVFNSVVGRFPLFDFSEAPPRISNPEERQVFEQLLVKRVQTEWHPRVDLSLIPEPLRDLLSLTLERNPEKRITATRLVELAEKELAAFLRVNEGPSRFSPEEELNQLKAYLPEARILALMPDSQKHDLKQRLEILQNAKGLTEDQKIRIDSLRELVI
ncbi:MAG TPA: protein kinase [Candidatus Saccharimonadales bacterium]|nr:protein kinase [Candidatus Saccharimonadales bacterium]